METPRHINKKNRNIRFVFQTFGLICGLYKCEIGYRYYISYYIHIWNKRKTKAKRRYILYIRNVRPTLNMQRHKLTQFKFTVLSEKKIHVKQNNKIWRRAIHNMLLYLIVCLSVINIRDIPTGQSSMDNPEKLADRVHMPMKNKAQTQHNMRWTPLSANKHN
jgi:hypothetical protein